ncbi:hypothetical protein [Streptomyces goshikiensis]|uniref:hypothetical protein n=1 Tax=Streptomyces goshikiensis TaxID=1942 RepID=UPI003333BFA7
MAEGWEYLSLAYDPEKEEHEKKLAEAGRAGWEAVGIASDTTSYANDPLIWTMNWVLLKRRISR